MALPNHRNINVYQLFHKVYFMSLVTVCLRSVYIMIDHNVYLSVRIKQVQIRI